MVVLIYLVLYSNQLHLASIANNSYKKLLKRILVHISDLRFMLRTQEKFIEF